MDQQNETGVFVSFYDMERQKMYNDGHYDGVVCANYVNYSDMGNFGFYLLRMRPGVNDFDYVVDRRFTVYLRESVDESVKIANLSGHFFNLKKMVVRVNNEKLNFDQLILLDEVHQMDQVGLETMKYELVSKHILKMFTTSKLCRKMFPKGLMSNEGEMRVWCRAVNYMLNDSIPDGLECLVWRLWGVEEQHVTIGDLLIGMFSRRREDFNNVDVSTRLMIFALSCLCLSQDTERTYLLMSIYNWIALGTCDSCLEKVLRDYITDTHPKLADFSYDFGNMTNTSFRIIEFSIDFGYKIYDCREKIRKGEIGNFMPVAAGVISVYKHSALVIKNLRSSVTVRMFTHDVELRYHAGVSLYRAVNLFTAAVKDTHFSRSFDTLQKKMIEIDNEATNNGYDGSLLDQVIIDLVEISKYFPILQSIAKRLAYILFYAAIPPSVMANFSFSSGDYYGSAVQALIEADWTIFEKPDLLALFAFGLDVAHMQAVLNCAPRRMVLGRM